MERVVIGVAGDSASGKGTAAEYLVKMGFKYFSLSDRIREEAARRKWGNGRKVLQDLGDEIRANFGAEEWAKRTAQLEEFKLGDRIVIDSIRHPSEIKYLREFFEAKIIGVTASPETLFKRMRERNREGDPKTFEEFMEMQKREMGVEGSSAMQVHKCLEIADGIILNEMGNFELNREIDNLLEIWEIDIPGVGKERDKIF